MMNLASANAEAGEIFSGSKMPERSATTDIAAARLVYDVIESAEPPSCKSRHVGLGSFRKSSIRAKVFRRSSNSGLCQDISAFPLRAQQRK
jgi:hypothetical protein